MARRLLSQGVRVAALVREPERFNDLAAAGLELPDFNPDNGRGDLPEQAALFYSIPPLTPAEDIAMHKLLCALNPRRVVYISSTGVYGDASEVNENTVPCPHDDRGRARLAAEIRMKQGAWSTLILRAAAIYGPFRGVHTAIREGRLPRSAGSGVISRIHAEDLAALAVAGLFSDLEGAWPVADDTPCTSAEIADWYVREYGGEFDGGLREFSVAGRRVNGTKIREMLGLSLRYPSWKAGMPASLLEEQILRPRQPLG